jgi:GNAT superfamily N-acetyltransferase
MPDDSPARPAAPPRTAVIIRHAVDADYDDLCPLIAGLDAFHRVARPDFFQAADGPARPRDFISGLIAGPDSAILVAEAAPPEADGPLLVGFAMLLLQVRGGLPIVVPRRIVEVENLFVADGHRRAGTGRALLERARAWAAARHAAYVEIAAHAFNRDALRFYEALGYETSTRRLLLRVA